MSSSSRRAIADFGKAAAVTVVLGLILWFLYGVPEGTAVAVPVSVVIVSLLPIPAAFMASRHGVPASLTMAVLAGGLTFALSAVLACGLLVFLLAGVVGTATGLMIRRGVPQKYLLMAVSGLFLLAMVGWMALMLEAAGVGLVEAFGRISDHLVESWRASFVSMLGEQEADSTLQSFRDTFDTLPYLLPGLMVFLSIIFSGINTMLGRRVFERLGESFPSDFSFKDFRLHFGFIYMVTAGIVCELYTYINDASGAAVDVVGMNLLIISLGLYFVQGVAVAHFFLSYYKVSTAKRVGAYLLLVGMQLFLLLVSWMGLFDAGLDYRRRFSKRNMQGQHR